METKDLIDLIAKVFAAIGICVAALNYRSQTKVKRAEWLKSLFEKFYEKEDYKEVRRWLDSGELERKVNLDDFITKDDERFTDFLNFFEFIAKLECEGQLTYKDITDLFEYYLKKIKASPVSNGWIDQYGFEKLRTLLMKIR